MKDLQIERVENGWVVRPYEPAMYGCCATVRATYVYTNIADLQGALPTLLGALEPAVTRTENAS